MYILGIDTSCDDTSVAIVKNGREVLSNIVSSQIDLHQKYGGVVPEIASRAHIKMINICLKEALKEAKIDPKRLNAVAVTYGPGLIGSLLIGLQTAKAIAFSLKIPLIGINHIEAHIYSPFLEYRDIKYPILSLLVSGGHTELVYLLEEERYEVLAFTLDDAAGEAYDKVSKILNLGYPGGPIIERLAERGDKNKIRFPGVKLKSGRLGFSFSGLKTSVRYFLKEKDILNKVKIEDIAAGFQEAVFNILLKPVEDVLIKKKVKSIFLVGGVASNRSLRERFKEISSKYKVKAYFPSKIYCTDNAAMIAGLGYLKYKKKKFSDFRLDAHSRLTLN